MKSLRVAVLALAAVLAAARPSPQSKSAGGDCNLKEVLIARGTSESGPYGFIVGDPLVAELKRQMPGLKYYAVNYPADLNQGPGTEKGAADVARHVNAGIASCPTAKFALVGYSQGARVVRIGATKLSLAAQDHVVAAVVYGDAGDKPGARHAVKFPPKLLAKLRNNCHNGDPNCNESGSFTNHMKYNSGTWHKESAKFIVAGFKGLPLPLTEDPPWAVSGGRTSTGTKGGKTGKRL